jgi:hypothetical protein
MRHDKRFDVMRFKDNRDRAVNSVPLSARATMRDVSNAATFTHTGGCNHSDLCCKLAVQQAGSHARLANETLRDRTIRLRTFLWELRQSDYHARQ